MKVAIFHNRYRQAGGEDAVFNEERALLLAKGHEVAEFVSNNDDINDSSFFGLARAGLNTVWNHHFYKVIRQFLRRIQPDIAHFHNTFPVLSPSAYYAASAEGVPIVQTIHNFRLLCPNAILYRDGQVCEECIGKFLAWPGIAHACYRQSRAATATTAGMLSVHRLLGTWERKVHAYVALTEYARNKCIAGGIPATKLHVKPNFVFPDPGTGSQERDYFLFVGRLVPEKGLNTLLKAWAIIGEAVPLKIVGNGPLAPEVEHVAASLPSVEFLGPRPSVEVYDLLGRARALIFSSEWYETFGRVIVEAFAKGRPVIAANMGAASELVQDGLTGLHYSPLNPADLAAKIRWACQNPDVLAAMGDRARLEYEAKYTAERNYEMLMNIYETARESVGRAR